MKTKIFTKNKDGKIEITEKEMQKLIDESYKDGYDDGYAEAASVQRPYLAREPYITWWHDTKGPTYREEYNTSPNWIYTPTITTTDYIPE